MMIHGACIIKYYAQELLSFNRKLLEKGSIEKHQLYQVNPNWVWLKQLLPIQRDLTLYCPRGLPLTSRIIWR